MNDNNDPRIVALEKWMASLHNTIFETSSLAQNLVSQAQKTMKDVVEDDEDYVQLKRNYDIAVSVYQHNNANIDRLIEFTIRIQKQTQMPLLHFAQCFAAGVCSISCQRMIDGIPEDLQNDESVSGELKRKLNGHKTMWRHLVGDLESGTS